MSQELYTIDTQLPGHEDEEWSYPCFAETRSGAYAIAIRAACNGIKARITRQGVVICVWGPKNFEQGGYPYEPILID